MTALSVLAGALVILAVGWDVALTVLHPAARGPLSYYANRTAWSIVRRVSSAFGRRLLSFAGPLAMGSNVAMWITGLWLGFALVFLPYEGLADSLYLSGEALTTVGFGDTVGSTRALQVLATLEAGTGLGAFTAAISYVLSVYPLVTELRSEALHVADFNGSGLQGAARVVARAGEAELVGQLRALTVSNEHIRRFQILYYFESGDESETVTTLLQSACFMCLVLRWGVDRARRPAAGLYGAAFERTLDRVFCDLERDFIGGRRRRMERPPALCADVAREALGRIRAAVRATAPELVAYGEQDLESLARFLTRAESVTAAVAREHRQTAASLLDPAV